MRQRKNVQCGGTLGQTRKRTNCTVSLTFPTSLFLATSVGFSRPGGNDVSTWTRWPMLRSWVPSTRATTGTFTCNSFSPPTRLPCTITMPKRTLPPWHLERSSSRSLAPLACTCTCRTTRRRQLTGSCTRWKIVRRCATSHCCASCSAPCQRCHFPCRSTMCWTPCGGFGRSPTCTAFPCTASSCLAKAQAEPSLQLPPSKRCGNVATRRCQPSTCLLARCSTTTSRTPPCSRLPVTPCYAAATSLPCFATTSSATST
mmetsp:Transcript_12343/g.39078  ORF Transcript_12343/g.39078 Transcript_12343/m.39078 type:complete len:258 (-) Transcript_12343:326-1099(-)